MWFPLGVKTQQVSLINALGIYTILFLQLIIFFFDSLLKTIIFLSANNSIFKESNRLLFIKITEFCLISL